MAGQQASMTSANEAGDDTPKQDVSRPHANFDALKHLNLTGVKLSDEVLSYGAFPRETSFMPAIYKADYNGIPCAAKRANPMLLWYFYAKDIGVQQFIQECLQHSQLEHKNIVKMLGVSYYHDDNASDQVGRPEPVLIMELIDYSLSQLIDYEGLCL